MAAAARVIAEPSANVTRVSNFDLTGIIQYQRECLRDKKYSILGRVTNLRLGIDDRAEYFHGDAFKRLSATTKIVGLTIEWPQHHAPYIGFAPDQQTVLFVDGIQRPPKMGCRAFQKLDLAGTKLPPGVKWQGSKLVADDKNGWVRQSMYDFASGRLMGRDGTGFCILQPVEQIVVLANVKSYKFNTSGTLMTLHGRPSFDGRHPFLMVSPDSPEAHLAGGRFTFDAV